MSKDPAFLFYSSDFLTGTMTMTDDQVGKYIRLLCLQHQKGLLTDKDMLYICKSYDEDIYSKFKNDGAGFYNERLLNECDRRKKYSESRRKNRLSEDKVEDMKNISLTYDKHMETETETITVNENKAEKNKIPPTIEMIKSYVKERGSSVKPLKFFDFYESKNWMVGKNKMKDWQAAIRTWEDEKPKPAKRPNGMAV